MFVAVVVVVVASSPGWGAFKAYFLDGTIYRESFPEILDAFWLNVKLFLTAEPVSYTHLTLPTKA